jgi:pimeloyl-ACP methyl ester carboxylesterase
MDKITSSTPDLYCETCGDGPDILFVHGFASSGRMWDALVRDLSRSARCWCVDLFGFGASCLPDDAALTLDYHLDCLIDFCERRGIRPTTIIGHSMGGMLTLKFALARPDWVERLVVICPVVSGRFLLQASQLIATPLGRSVLPYVGNLWTMMQNDALARLFVLPPYISQPLQESIKLDFKRTRWQAAEAALYSMAHENLTPRLDDIRHPTLVMVGGRDLTVPPSEGRLAAERIPNARLAWFPNAHHQPLDEEPERGLPLVRAFALEGMSASVDRMFDHDTMTVSKPFPPNSGGIFWNRSI